MPQLNFTFSGEDAIKDYTEVKTVSIIILNIN